MSIVLETHDEYLLRQQNRDALITRGIQPYPSTVGPRQGVADFLALFKNEPVNMEHHAVLCGRLRLKRQHGKITFGKLEDATGAIQIVFSLQVLGNAAYMDVGELLDIGDIIEVTGSPFVTRKGEHSLKVTTWRFLAKALRPLPAKWHGLEDQELRYRKRYLDVLINPQVRKIFTQRTLFIQNLRRFLEKNHFMEVAVPVLEQLPGGADAKPFTTHHDALDLTLYLRISLELYQKRLLVGGFEKIYAMGPVFRNEGMDREHLQEFLSMECYWAYANYEDMMHFVEEMYTTIIEETFGTLDLSYGDTLLHFQTPWPRVEYRDALLERTDIDIEKYPDAAQLVKAIHAKKLPIAFEPNIGRGRIIDRLYKKFVRPHFVQPSFLIHHPVDVSPLAKSRPNIPTQTERFQPMVVGMEVGNGFSELNDPVDQRARFREQQRLKDAGDQEAQPFDEDFVEALEYGMPPAAGFGVGVDRLFMICANQPSIRDVIFFPVMKPHI